MELGYVNIARLFLVRPLGIIERNEFLELDHPHVAEIIKTYGFEEAYFQDTDHPTDIEQPVFLLFKPKNLQKFQEFVKSEYEEELLIEDYDYPDNHVVLLYKFPEIYEEDYKLIRRGKYSRTSGSYKSLFPKEKNGIVSFYSLVFDRNPKLRKVIEEKFNTILDQEDELYHFPDMRRETLDISKILKDKSK